MRPWNEPHYTRAQEFLRAVADAVSGAPTTPAAVPPGPPATVTPRAEPPASPPAAAPRADVPPAPAPASAGAVFKKIPWKK